MDLIKKINYIIDFKIDFKFINEDDPNLLQFIQSISSKNLIFELYKVPKKYQGSITPEFILIEIIEPKQIDFLKGNILNLHINNELWENDCIYWIIYNKYLTFFFKLNKN